MGRNPTLTVLVRFKAMPTIIESYAVEFPQYQTTSLDPTNNVFMGGDGMSPSVLPVAERDVTRTETCFWSVFSAQGI